MTRDAHFETCNTPPNRLGDEGRRSRFRAWRRLAILALDGLIASGALWLAMALRFDGSINPRFLPLIPQYTTILVIARIASSRLFRLHRWSFLLSGLQDAVRVAYAGLTGTGLFILGTYFFRLTSPPRSVVALEFFVSTAVMGVLRFSPRLAWVYHVDRARVRRDTVQRTLIIGAGSAGEMLLRDLRRSREHDHAVVGFLDDDSSKWGSIVGGKPILGPIHSLPDLVEKYRIAEVLIAIPQLQAQRIREILSLCSALKIRFKILPLSAIYLHKQATLSMLQELSPQDLLQRDEVDFARSPLAHASKGRRVLVSGAAGSIGGEISRQLLQSGVATLVMVDINENELYLSCRRLETRFPDTDLRIEIADIREKGRLSRLFETYRPEHVFHAAAHKHVPLMETAPCEAVKNNILGTRNLVELAGEYACERFVFISTDKAVRPTSVMGASKRVGEILVRHAEASAPGRFRAVRFGNVLDSNGSVVPLFREQIAAGGPVTVTHPEVRRYFMTISEAVGLVLTAAYGEFGALCVLDMGEQIRIVDLARHMITMSGLTPEDEIPIEFTGLRPGEKLYEELMAEEEEHLERADQRIHMLVSPPPGEQCVHMIDEVVAAAGAGDDVAVLRLLRSLIPSYCPASESGLPAHARCQALGHPTTASD